jgi:CDP-ribitol ribitolphosphotransferase
MNRLEYALAATVLQVCSAVFSLFPIRQNKVVFASARSDKLRGNMRFIHARMRRTWSDAEYVFLLRRYSYGLLGKLAYMWSLIGAQYHLSTARLFVVDNAYFPVHVRRHRKGTTVVQVWHAAGALKRFGMDAAEDSRTTERGFLHKHYDWVIVGSKDAVEPYASALRTPADRVVPLGMARTDFFFDDEAIARTKAQLLDEYPQLGEGRVVLYAPTFRGYGRHKRLVDALDAVALKKQLPDDSVLVYKMHPVIDEAPLDLAGFDVVVGPQVGLNGLLTMADVLITDYSASVFEWAILGKPLVLFAPDLESYERDPGFYLEYPDELFGTPATTSAEVGEIIVSGEFDAGGAKRFAEKHMALADGDASARFVDFAEELTGIG